MPHLPRLRRELPREPRAPQRAGRCRWGSEERLSRLAQGRGPLRAHVHAPTCPRAHVPTCPRPRASLSASSTGGSGARLKVHGSTYLLAQDGNLQDGNLGLSIGIRISLHCILTTATIGSPLPSQTAPLYRLNLRRSPLLVFLLLCSGFARSLGTRFTFKRILIENVTIARLTATT